MEGRNEAQDLYDIPDPPPLALFPHLQNDQADGLRVPARSTFCDGPKFPV